MLRAHFYKHCLCPAVEKGQSTVGAGIRVIFISSCPSAQKPGRSLSAAEEDPGGSGRRKVCVLVGGAQLQCLDNTTIKQQGSGNNLAFWDTWDRDQKSKKRSTQPFFWMLSPRAARTLRHSTFLDGNKLVRGRRLPPVLLLYLVLQASSHEAWHAHTVEHTDCFCNLGVFYLIL